MTVSLRHGQPEKLTARAIREGKNLEALMAELLEAASADLGDNDRAAFGSDVPDSRAYCDRRPRQQIRGGLA